MGSEALGMPLKTCLRGHADFTESQVPLSLCRIQASTLPPTFRVWLKQVPVPSTPNPPKLVPKIPNNIHPRCCCIGTPPLSAVQSFVPAKSYIYTSSPQPCWILFSLLNRYIARGSAISHSFVNITLIIPHSF